MTVVPPTEFSCFRPFEEEWKTALQRQPLHIQRIPTKRPGSLIALDSPPCRG